MIVIGQTEITPWVTSLQIRAMTRGAEQVETLGGTLYTYGTGTGEQLILTLGQVPTLAFGYLKDTLTGAGNTFWVRYPADADHTVRLCALLGELQSDLVTPADGGLWDLSFTVVTVD